MNWQIKTLWRKPTWVLLTDEGQWMTDENYTLADVTRYMRNWRNFGYHMTTTMRYW